MPNQTKAFIAVTVCLLRIISTAGEHARGAASALPKEKLPASARASLDREIQALAKTKAEVVPDVAGVTGKLDVRLADAWKAAMLKDSQTAITALKNQKVKMAANGRDVVVVVLLEDGANLEEAERSVRSNGATVVRSGAGSIKATVPVGLLGKLALANGVRNVRPVLPPRELTAATTEGVAVSLADAWHSAGFTGQGVKVAVVDSGFANLAALKAQNEIPASALEVNYSSTAMTAGTSVHGCACAEIVYDLAPGAQLYLIKIDDVTDLVLAKNYCVANGIKIVTSSSGWDCLNFHDGMAYSTWYTTAANHPDKAVEDAAAAGILWVNAAGNEHFQHSLIDWRDADSDKYLDWTSASDNVNALFLNGSYTVPANTLIDVVMTWNRWPTTNQDFDLYLVKWDGSSLTVVSKSQQVQSGGSQSYPYEEIYYTTTAEAQYGVVVVKYSASTSPKFILRYYCDNSEGSDVVPYYFGYGNFEEPVPGSVTIPGDSASAFTVGAVDYLKYETGPIESFSSLGPNNRAYTGGTAVTKPDICGPDCVTGVSYGMEGFAGTSAATPHVAGLAALVKGAFPSYTPAQIRSFLESHAFDLGASGKDNTYGAGTAQLPAPAELFPLLVTVNQAAGQRDPVNAAPVNFTVAFSEPVSDFTADDVVLSGSAPGAKTATVTGGGSTYNVAVSGMTGSGTVVATVPAGKATSALGNSNKASTSADNTVAYDVTPPSVTIDQAAAQTDPLSGPAAGISACFTVTFSEGVTGFAADDVTVSGSTPGTKTVTVTGSGSTYNVAVTGMTGDGTVIATVASGKTQDMAGNANLASTSTDNVVTFDRSDTYIRPPEVNAGLTQVGSFDGCFYSEDAFSTGTATSVRGTLSVKVTSLGGKLTAKAVLRKGSLSFKAGAWTGTADGTCRASMSARGGETLDLYVRQNRIWGTLSGGTVEGALALDGARNRFADRADAGAQALLNGYRGYYTVSLPAHDGRSLGAADVLPEGVGYLAVTVGSKGSAKIAGVLADGTKVSQASRLIVFGEDGACVPLFAPLYSKRGWAGGLLWLDGATRALVTDRDLGWYVRWENPGKGPEGFSMLLDACGGWYGSVPSLAAHYLFTAEVGDAPYAYAGGAADFAAEALPEGLGVTVAGLRLSLDKGAKPVKNADGSYSYGGNSSMAKLSFTPRTGLFKGSFSLYYDYDSGGRPQHKTVVAPYAGALTPVRDGAFGDLPPGMGHCLVPDNNPAWKSYKVKRSFPVWLDAE